MVNLSQNTSAHIQVNKSTLRFYYTTKMRNDLLLCSMKTTIEACWRGTTAAMNRFVFISMFHTSIGVYLPYTWRFSEGQEDQSESFCSHLSCFVDSVQPCYRLTMFVWRTLSCNRFWEWNVADWSFLSMFLCKSSPLGVKVGLLWGHFTILHQLMWRSCIHGPLCQIFKLLLKMR